MKQNLLHTPAPWVFVPGPDSNPRTRFAIYSEASGAVVAVASPLTHSPDFPVREANARLIAAAPDLLREVRKNNHLLGDLLTLLRIVNPESVHTVSIEMQIKANTAAIAKAQGEQ